MLIHHNYPLSSPLPPLPGSIPSPCVQPRGRDEPGRTHALSTPVHLSTRATLHALRAILRAAQQVGERGGCGCCCCCCCSGSSSSVDKQRRHPATKQCGRWVVAGRLAAVKQCGRWVGQACPAGATNDITSSPLPVLTMTLPLLPVPGRVLPVPLLAACPYADLCASVCAARCGRCCAGPSCIGAAGGGGGPHGMC